MSMTIIPKGTNDKMLVNYANVISIFTMENTTVVDTETDEEKMAYAIVAEVVDNEDVVILGVYDTGIQMEQALATLINWLVWKFRYRKFAPVPRIKKRDEKNEGSCKNC